jgi:transposase
MTRQPVNLTTPQRARRRQVEQGALFYNFTIDAHMPADHLLRSMDRFVDLSELRRDPAPFCSSMSRPSIDPEPMIRMLIVGYCFGIRSDRRRLELFAHEKS